MNESHGFLEFSSGATATVSWTAERALVAIVGEVDPCFAEPGARITTLLAEQNLPVDIDLTGVDFFSAAGANWLASLYATLGTEVRVVAASDQAREVLSLCDVPLRSPARIRPPVRESAQTT